jgi:hypothetical protein
MKNSADFWIDITIFIVSTRQNQVLRCPTDKTILLECPEDKKSPSFNEHHSFSGYSTNFIVEFLSA